jgi:uncharacterized membrane protein
MTRFDRVTDLSLVGALVVVAVLALLVPGIPRIVEWAVAIPLVLIAPGYAVVAALFPASPSAGQPMSSQGNSPGWAARVSVLLVTSVLVVAIVGVLLSLVGALTLVAVVLVLAASTLGGVVIAWYRRRDVPTDQRADPLVGIGSMPEQSGLSGIQTFALVAGTVALVGAVAITGASPAGDASFSEASLLAGEDTDELLGSNGNVTFVAGESNAVYLRVQNHEGAETTYHIVGTLQRIGPDGGVLESQRVDAGQQTISAGTSDVFYRQITPSMTGDALRLQYLIYTDSIPADPGVENADLTLRHWLEVVEEDQQ